MAHLGPVPDHPRHPGLADNLATALGDPLALLQGLGLVLPGERLGPPDVRVVLVLVAQHDGAVPDVADVDLAPTDEGDAGGGAGGAGESTGSLGPLLCNYLDFLDNFILQFYFTILLLLSIFELKISWGWRWVVERRKLRDKIFMDQDSDI